MKPDYAEAYYGRGFSKAKLEDYRGTIIDYSKVIELKSDDTSAYSNRGVYKLILYQKDSGCLDFSKAGELGSVNASLKSILESPFVNYAF